MTRRHKASRSKRDSAGARAAAFGVHVFTALGAGCALMALVAAARSDWVTMFGWLGVALFIDGVDGALARHLRVADTLPRWSGDALDLVVDFSTYVLIPAYAISAGGLLPQPLAIPLAVAIAVTGAIYCADREMKTQDNSFRGFPVLWNIAAFHLFVLKAEPWAAAAIVAALIVLTFAPIRTIHPLRVERLRPFNVAVLLAWVTLAFYALVSGLEPGLFTVIAINIVTVYFLAIGLFLQRR